MLKKPGYRKFAALHVSLALTLSCLTSVAPAQSLRVGRFTGEDIFRGLFFGSGPVAEVFPELWRDSRSRVLQTLRERPDHVAALDSVEQVVMRGIDREDSEFMKRFGAEISSGDHVRVDAALKGAAAAILRVLEAEYGEEAIARPGQAVDPGQTCVAVTVFITVVSVVAVLAVVTTAVAIHTVAAEVDVIQQEVAMPKARIAYEMWVDRIATRLAETTR